ncbi:MAG: phosphodiester glycosidase family protein, partial [Clostridiales bacterium]|nr:phosphodiester glycosidase family protein [Clostridiales bacterium]
MKKRGFRAGLATLLCAFLIGLSAASPVKAASILYEIKTVKTLTRGVTLETRQTITSDGPLDIHVLRAPLNDPYINVAPADSTKDYGLKDTVAALLSERGAIAGVNGSFFGVAGTYSAAFGPVIKDGQLISVSGDINQGKEDFGALFIDNQSAPFFSFLKTSMHFYHDGQENIEVNSYNTITDMEYPVIVTTAALQNTSSLDGRFSGLVKILVRNQEIFYISAPGETVSIPADGFALIIKKETAERVGASFQTGQRAELRVEPSVDFSQIKMAIGGGGLILRGGEFVKTGTVIEGRQPRTAVGISQDKT